MDRAFLAVAAALALAACGTALPAPRFHAESPAGSGAWVPVPAEPAWVASPPAREGCLVIVAEGRSNLRSIAASGPRPSADREAAERVRSALLPVVGEEEAARAAALVPGVLRMVERACREELVSREAVPGNTLCTAWALWEVPLAPILAALPEGKRDAARDALGR